MPGAKAQDVWLAQTELVAVCVCCWLQHSAKSVKWNCINWSAHCSPGATLRLELLGQAAAAAAAAAAVQKSFGHLLLVCNKSETTCDCWLHVVLLQLLPIVCSSGHTVVGCRSETSSSITCYCWLHTAVATVFYRRHGPAPME